MYTSLKKRFFDLFISITLLLISLPFQVLIYIIILSTLKENPIFIQRRGITLEKFNFSMLKFRTIKSSLLTSNNKHLSKNNILISEFSESINKFSKWLRKTGLDELPQLYNIIAGQMSLVGPRPLMQEELSYIKDEYPELYQKRSLMNCLPGLTGVWQIFGDRDYGVRNLIELDSFYENNKGIKLDIKILFYTFVIMTHAKNSGSILSRLNLFERIFTSSAYHEVNINPHGNIIVFDSGKGVKKYRINIPVEWWYINDSITTSINDSQHLKVIQFRKEANSRT
ncbi:MAG: sugar transferase [Melioribacter sp.]|nr:sugar transferase [Melioribacter sp.]